MQNRRSLLATALLLAFARVAKARLMSTQLKPPPNAQGMTLTFHDEFDGPLDISYNTPGTKWTITPYNNSYALDAASDAYDPAHGVNAFSVANSILTITMSKDSSGAWHSGIMYSVHPDQTGFAQRYGYFECRMKMPAGPGVWPAFWLNGTGQNATPPAEFALEIDVVEYYGHDTTGYMASWNGWLPDGSMDPNSTSDWIHPLPELAADFHTYAVKWTPTELIYYFDDVEVTRLTPRPGNPDKGCVIITLALGGGWPIDQTQNPNYLQVDWVRVWQFPEYL